MGSAGRSFDLSPQSIDYDFWLIWNNNSNNNNNNNKKIKILTIIVAMITVLLGWTNFPNNHDRGATVGNARFPPSLAKIIKRPVCECMRNLTTGQKSQNNESTDPTLMYAPTDWALKL